MVSQFGSLGFGEDDGRGVGEPLNETEYVSPYTVQDLDHLDHLDPNIMVRSENWRVGDLTLIAKSLNF